MTGNTTPTMTVGATITAVGIGALPNTSGSPVATALQVTLIAAGVIVTVAVIALSVYKKRMAK